MKECIHLFAVFFRIGALTFGGGYAMLPILQREIVRKNGWVSEEEILNYFAIGQCTPGIIAINTATFVGQKRKGALGALLATFGFMAPSIIIISIIAASLQNFAQTPAVQHAFVGVRCAVAVMILNAVIKLQRAAFKTAGGYVIFGIVLIVGLLFKPSPVPIIIGAALAGWLLYGRGK